MKCPLFNGALIVSDDAQVAAVLSALYKRPNTYLPIVDGPRLARPDGSAEAIRRANTIARVKARRVFLAGLATAQVDTIAPYLSDTEVVRIGSKVELERLAEASDLEPLLWGDTNIGVGLLTAMRQGKRMVFNRSLDRMPEYVPPTSDHLVVCEAGEPISEVIAANYAFALGAGLLVIPELDDLRSEQMLEEFYSLDSGGELSPTEKLARLRDQMRGWLPEVPVPPGGSLTFISRSLPLGFAFPEAPSTHLFSYPDLGICVAQGFAAEQPRRRGTNIIVAVDPNTTDAPEIDTAAAQLKKRRLFVRVLGGAAATVQRFSDITELFPYDVLILATHCGDAPGYRWTYEFTDSEGAFRVLVVDIAVSFSPSRNEDKVVVRQHIVFHSLDGVDWADPERETKLRVGPALNDWVRLTRDEPRLEPKKREGIPRVQGSAVLKMHDQNYLPHPRSLADKKTPIILNNSCTSWRELAGRFVFAGARCYVGTIFPILASEAEVMTSAICGRYFGQYLPHAVWRAHRDAYGGSPRRPYVVTGVYPQRLRVTLEHVPRHIIRLLTAAHSDWVRRRNGFAANSEPQRRAGEIVEFYEREIESCARRWFAR